jgi:hypothetical protein
MPRGICQVRDNRPIKMVERLWSSELPEFNSIDAANELIGALIMGLWNRLTRHQERSAPFRLVRPDVMATQEGLATLATIRCQELDGFVEGLFGEEETVGLPERAHRGLETLSEMRALMAAVVQMARDETKAATDQDLQTSLRNVREMTKIAEHKFHAIVLSCARSSADARSIAIHETDAALTRCHWRLLVRLWRICLRRSL